LHFKSLFKCKRLANPIPEADEAVLGTERPERMSYTHTGDVVDQQDWHARTASGLSTVLQFIVSD